MKPPGLDFGASSLDFEASRLDCGASRPPAFLWLGFPHSATQLDKCGTVSCLGFIPFVLLPSSKALPKCGRRRCPPLGAFNPPPTEGGAGRARSICFNPNIKHQTPTSNTLLQVSHEIFVFPLPIIPPQARPVHRSPAQKYCLLYLFLLFGSIFSPSGTRFKNDFEKTSKKVRKSKILASQNPPQTLPKSPPNRRSKKTAFFRAFVV